MKEIKIAVHETKEEGVRAIVCYHGQCIAVESDPNINKQPKEVRRMLIDNFMGHLSRIIENRIFLK